MRSPPSFVHGTHRACSKMPEKDTEYLTPATRLLEKKREMAEVEEALATTKEVSSRCTHTHTRRRTHTHTLCLIAIIASVVL